ncbi:MAG: SCO family protein [Magnetovibrio sp.]|nr:SCO family protein [Magnetovibrio sp.]
MMENHNSEIITDDDYRGRFMLITFGYTYCPDICPTNLVNMSEALSELGDRADQVVPLFVTVDPTRDTAKRLRDYVDHFDKRIIGLTGPQQMIDSITSRYKVVSNIHRPEGWTEGEYTVDHTASIFLMDPNGEFLVKFAHGMDPVDMANRIQDFM